MGANCISQILDERIKTTERSEGIVSFLLNPHLKKTAPQPSESEVKTSEEGIGLFYFLYFPFLSFKKKLLDPLLAHI